MRIFYLRLRLLLLLLMWLGAGRAVFGQAPTWQWANSPGRGEAWSTAVDAAGNTYFTGNFTGTATFGAITLTSAGNADVFVAKLSPTGIWQWATSAGDSNVEEGTGITLDGNGNVLITGSFGSPTITFGPATLTNAGRSDIFVAKLSPTGAWQWAVSAGGSDNEEGRGVAVDGSGNVVITGAFASPSIAFGATTLTTPNDVDVFVAKLTPAGTWQWAAAAAGVTNNDHAAAVAVDSNGNIFITGGFGSPTIAFGSTTLTNTGGWDVFVAKLSPTGAWQWATPAVGASWESDDAFGIAVDGSGGVVITGFFESSAITFGAITLTNISAGDSDGFVAKLTPTGTWQWATHFGSSDDEAGRSVAVDGSGSIVVTGGFRSPTITFGATTLTSVGNVDIFVVKLSPTGAWQWAVGAGGSDFEGGTGVAIDGSGSVVVSGWSASPVITFGANTFLNSMGNGIIFLARLSTVTGLPEDPSQALFTLAPNPARTTVQLTGTPGAPATLLDGLGRVVRTTALDAEGTAALDVRSLPAGLYLARVGGGRARRLVVE